MYVSGIKLAEDIELAIYVDEVTVRLFRNIEIGDVYANVKGDVEMTFGEMDDPDDESMSETNVFLDDTPLLRAANAGGKTFVDRPKLRESLTGVSYMKDSSAQVRDLEQHILDHHQAFLVRASLFLTRFNFHFTITASQPITSPSLPACKVICRT